MVKIKDVAREAEVSVASVSRVLSESRPVSPETRKAVLAASEKLGYQANYLARALRRRTTRTLGVVVPHIANPFFIGVVQSLERLAQAAGYDLFLCDSQDSTDIEGQRIRALMSRQVDGIFMISCHERKSAASTAEAARHVPIVAVDRRVKGIAVDVIGVDNAAGIQAIMDHLRESGRHRLAFVGAREDTSTARERLEAFRNAAAEFHPRSRERILLGDYSIEWGEKATTDLLAAGDLPEGIVCGNDLIALGVIRTLRDGNIRVPAQVAVTGFDDIEFCRFVDPTITTVRQPVDEIGAEAMARLTARIDGHAGRPGQIRIAPELIVRASSG